MLRKSESNIDLEMFFISVVFLLLNVVFIGTKYKDALKDLLQYIRIYRASKDCLGPNRSKKVACVWVGGFCPPIPPVRL